MKLSKWRRTSQIVFFLIFILLFLLTRYPYSHGIVTEIGLRFSPLTPVFLFIKDLHIHWILWPGLIVLLITPFLGRVFCGWMCPLGTLLDLTSKIVKSPNNRKTQKLEKLRYVKFALLIGLLIMALFSVHLWGYFDPLSIFNRALTIVFYPIVTLLSENTLLTFSNLSFLGNAPYFVYDQYKNIIMPENQAHYQQLFWIALFIGLILAGEKLSRRFWCRYLCPAGALLGFLSQFRFLERVVQPSCPACGLCQVECKMGAIPENDFSHTNKVECIQCFSCADTCPEKYKSITYRWQWKPYHSQVDYSRRQFLGTTVTSVTALGLIGLHLPNKTHYDQQIRPPGSLPEKDFRDKCIRCMECIRVCASNGACLQPSGIQNSIDDLWLPIAEMRTGYCEFECNLCGQVCPTGAILPLPLNVKQKTPMGVAHFDKNLCIPYSRNEECLVCEEHCPTPDKAIKFEERDYTDPLTGKTKKIKYPFVVAELCIGCGICVTKCPLEGKAGIFITAEHRRSSDQLNSF